MAEDFPKLPPSSLPEGRLPIWAKAFIEVLRRTGNRALACRQVKINASTLNGWMERSPEFAEMVADARDEACDYMELEAWNRAVEGIDEPIIFHGKLQYLKDHEGNLKLDENGKPQPLTIKKYDTPLLIFLLKAERPQKFDRGRDLASRQPAEAKRDAKKTRTEFTDRLRKITQTPDSVGPESVKKSSQSIN